MDDVQLENFDVLGESTRFHLGLLLVLLWTLGSGFVSSSVTMVALILSRVVSASAYAYFCF